MELIMKKQKVNLAQPQENKAIGIKFFESGTTGLKEYGGFVQEAYNAQLYYPQVAPLYDRLRTSMPEMRMISSGFTAWSRYITPIVELPDEPTDDDKRYQDFLLSDFDNMEGGFGRFIESTVSRAPFDGFVYFSAVPSIRNPEWKPPASQNGVPDNWCSEEDDGLIGLRRLSIRDTSTFYNWEFDKDKKMVGMWQQDFPSPKILLPLEDALHMTFGSTTNPEGDTPMQAVWRLERLRYGLEVVFGIGAEHAAGYLSASRTVAGDLSDTDKSNVRNAARAILTAQEGNYALWPYGMQGEVKDVTFSAGSMILDAIKHYSILSLSVYMMQFMALNTLTGSGSFAAADDSSSMGVFTFNAMLDGFASQYDQQIGKRLYEWNKAAFPNLTKRPRIKFSHIEKNVALGELGTFMSQMKGILPLGDDDLKVIRKRSGFLSQTLPDTEEAPKAQPLEDVPLEDEAMNTKEAIEQSLRFYNRQNMELRKAQ